MLINAFTPKQVVERKLLQFIKEVETFGNVYMHKSLDQLMHSLIKIGPDDVVILDVDYEASVDYFHKMKAQFDTIQVIAIGTDVNINKVIQFHKIGFLAYIDFNFSNGDFLMAIKKAMQGSRYFSESQVNESINMILQDKDENKEQLVLEKNQNDSLSIHKVQAYLTVKEKAVCEYLLKGHTYKEISDIIGVTTFTINQKAKNIYKKLNVRSRSELSYKILR